MEKALRLEGLFNHSLYTSVARLGAAVKPSLPGTVTDYDLKVSHLTALDIDSAGLIGTIRIEITPRFEIGFLGITLRITIRLTEISTVEIDFLRDSPRSSRTIRIHPTADIEEELAWLLITRVR